MNYKKYALPAITLIITTIVAFCSIFSLYTSPKSDFQTSRAMEHLKQIGKSPHSVGMKNHDVVRNYITDQLDLLGVKWELQEELFYEPKSKSLANIKNIIVSIPGKKAQKTMAVVSHYDSVPNAPGASDAGLSIASMLECINIIKDEPPLDNNIIFLFTDGEEPGLLGMQSFMTNHKLSQNIDFVINFEARGTSGPSLMFETTQGNLNTVKAFRKASSNITSSSLMPDIYNTLPNNTDFNIAKNKKIQGLNFAFLCNKYNYHTLRDNLDNVNMTTFQQQGHHMLSCIRYYGNADIDSLYTNKNGVFFNILNFLFVIYSQEFMIAIKILILLLTFTTFILALVKKIINLKHVLISFLTQIIIGILLFFSLPLIQKVSIILGKDIYSRLTKINYSSIPLFVMMSLIVFIIVFIVYIPLTKKLDTHSLLFSSLIWWTFLCGITLFYFKGASYIFDWVLLCNSLVLLFTVLNKEITHKSWFNIIHLIPFWIEIIILYPLVFLFTETFSLLQFKFSSIILFLILILAMPHFHNVIKRKWLFVIGILVICGTLSIIEYNTSSMNYNMDDVSYYYYKNIEGVEDKQIDYYSISGTNYQPLKQNLDNPDLPIIEAKVINETNEGDNRIVTFKILTPVFSSKVFVNISNKDHHINKAVLNSKYSLPLNDDITIKSSAIKEDDMIITLSLPKKESVFFTVFNDISGFDELSGYGIYNKILKVNPNATQNLFASISVTKEYKY